MSSTARINACAWLYRRPVWDGSTLFLSILGVRYWNNQHTGLIKWWNFFSLLSRDGHYFLWYLILCITFHSDTLLSKQRLGLCMTDSHPTCTTNPTGRDCASPLSNIELLLTATKIKAWAFACLWRFKPPWSWWAEFLSAFSHGQRLSNFFRHPYHSRDAKILYTMRFRHVVARLKRLSRANFNILGSQGQFLGSRFSDAANSLGLATEWYFCVRQNSAITDWYGSMMLHMDGPLSGYG